MTQTTVHTTSAEAIEALILSCKPSIERLAWKRIALDQASGDTFLDFDDYMQAGLIGAWEATGHLERCTDGNLEAYLVGAAELEMMSEYRRFCGSRSHSVTDALSLDAPLVSESSFSLADVLPEKGHVSLSRTSQTRSQAVRGAVKRLKSGLQRRTMRHFYGLEGTGLNGAKKHVARELGVDWGSFCAQQRRALANLRKDERLCKVVGVEVEKQVMRIEKQVMHKSSSFARSYRLGRMLRARVGVEAAQ